MWNTSWDPETEKVHLVKLKENKICTLVNNINIYLLVGIYAANECKILVIRGKLHLG